MAAFALTGIEASEVPVVSRFLHHAFAAPMDQMPVWMEMAGHENLRVLRDDGKAVACLVRVPMGQYFGGEKVSLLGIAGVAVPPEHRGRGYALRMMRMAMQEGARDGFAVSGLYASTQALYRQVGFEQAAHRFRIEQPIASMAFKHRAGGIDALGEQDWPAMKKCYATFAASHDGMLDRGEYLWKRIKTMRGTEYTPFGVRRSDGGIDGYFCINQQRRLDSGRQNIELSDFVFTTPEAGKRLLGLLADYGTMGDDIAFHAGPTHPALLLLPQQRYKVSFKDAHMTRILDVRGAIEGRGYVPGITAEVHLDVVDDLIAANHGRWIVKVGGGRATVEAGGRGAVKMDVRALASIFGGFVTPLQAAAIGWANGEPEDLIAANVFVGSTPWVADMY